MASCIRQEPDECRRLTRRPGDSMGQVRRPHRGVALGAQHVQHHPLGAIPRGGREGCWNPSGRGHDRQRAGQRRGEPSRCLPDALIPARPCNGASAPDLRQSGRFLQAIQGPEVALGHEALSGSADRAAQLCEGGGRLRVGGDGERDATVVELIDDESFFASLRLTRQGAVCKSRGTEARRRHRGHDMGPPTTARQVPTASARRCPGAAECPRPALGAQPASASAIRRDHARRRRIATNQRGGALQVVVAGGQVAFRPFAWRLRQRDRAQLRSLLFVKETHRHGHIITDRSSRVAA